MQVEEHEDSEKLDDGMEQGEQRVLDKGRDADSSPDGSAVSDDGIENASEKQSERAEAVQGVTDADEKDDETFEDAMDVDEKADNDWEDEVDKQGAEDDQEVDKHEEKKADDEDDDDNDDDDDDDLELSLTEVPGQMSIVSKRKAADPQMEVIAVPGEVSLGLKKKKKTDRQLQKEKVDRLRKKIGAPADISKTPKAVAPAANNRHKGKEQRARDPMEYITKGIITQLHYRSGVPSMTGPCFNMIRHGVISKIYDNILRDTQAFVSVRADSTVDTKAVAAAFNRNGFPLFVNAESKKRKTPAANKNSNNNKVNKKDE